MSVEDWAEIRRLHRVEGMAIKAIARRLGVSRNAVRRALARDAPPKYERAVRGSIVDAVEPAVRYQVWQDGREPTELRFSRLDKLLNGRRYPADFWAAAHAADAAHAEGRLSRVSWNLRWRSPT